MWLHTGCTSGRSIWMACLGSGVGKVRKRDNAAVWGTEGEHKLRLPDDPFYKKFAAEASRAQMAIDIFCFRCSLGCLALQDNTQVFMPVWVCVAPPPQVCYTRHVHACVFRGGRVTCTHCIYMRMCSPARGGGGDLRTESTTCPYRFLSLSHLPCEYY